MELEEVAAMLDGNLFPTFRAMLLEAAEELRRKG